MILTENEMSIIMLTTAVGNLSEEKPLSLGEWTTFLNNLISAGLEPRIVFSDALDQIKEIGYDEAFVKRLEVLGKRAASVAFELEAYENRGIEIVTVLSNRYPIMLKRVLKDKKPPVLFYAGDIDLVNKVGIGLVGSRNVSEDGRTYTKKMVEKAADEHMIVFSGGAKGVDEISEKAAIESGTASVSFVADSIYTKIKKSEIMNAMSDGRMLLLSDIKPDVGFSIGRAMNRNKYIYASSLVTFVVESDYEKGGTWNGAMEALKKEWGNICVRDVEIKGNQMLIENGGIPYSYSNEKLSELFERCKQIKEKKEEVSPTENKPQKFEQLDLSAFMEMK